MSNKIVIYETDVVEIQVKRERSGFESEKTKTPWPVVHKRTIPAERPPLVGEVTANF
jgi:hypothetical protein